MQDFFGISSTSINKILLDAQLKEYNTNYQQHRIHIRILKTIQKNTTPTTPQLQTISHNHPLSLVSQNFRNIALTEHISSRHSYQQNAITHSLKPTEYRRNI